MDRLSALILCAVLVAIGFGWGLFYWHVSTLRDATLNRAGAIAAAQSRTLREHAEQTFTAASYAFRTLDRRPVQAGVQLGSDLHAIHSQLRWLRDSSRLFEGIGTIDANGWIATSADADSPPVVNLSDRDYFLAHRSDPDLGLRIGAPIVARPSGSLAIPISRRLEDDLGNFAGVVAARLRPLIFQELYSSVGADIVVLLRIDGTPLVTVRTGQSGDGAIAIGLTAILPDTDEGVLETKFANATGVHLIGYSRSRQFPIGVAVGFDLDTLLKGWRNDRAALAAVALASTATSLVLTVLLLRRIRRQWLLTAQLREARDSANEARVAAELANRAKSDFLAHMSHELRTPLNAINGFSEIIATQMFGPIGSARYVEYGRIIKNSGAHLLSIINNILDLAKVDAGKWEVDPKPTNLFEVANDLRMLTTGRAEAHQVALLIDMPADLPSLMTDRRLLLQILVNLTTNGIKFTPAGGSVAVIARAEAEEMSITVTDTGSGMSASDIANALQPFGHGSSALARKYHDTGLGLPLSKRFIEILGGRLIIDSKPGQGTRMAIRLPLAATEAPIAAHRAGRRTMPQTAPRAIRG